MALALSGFTLPPYKIWMPMPLEPSRLLKSSRISVCTMRMSSSEAVWPVPMAHGKAGIVRIGAEPGKPPFELEPKDAVEFPGFAFGEGFTDAKDDGKALFQRKCRLLAHEVRAFPKHMAAFGMAREHPCAACFAEHGRGNLAGESTGFGGVHILCADEDAGGAVETFLCGFQSGANTMTSLSSGAPPRIEASSCAVALASVRVLFIFQLAAIMVRIEYSHERNLWIRPSLSHIQSINERVFSGILVIPAPLAHLPESEGLIQMDGGRVADPHFKHSP